jgi:chromosome segregation ATPase
MIRRILILTTLVMVLGSCASAIQDKYFDLWDAVGVEKREILVDRVEAAQETQQEAQKEFASALEEFSALINFKGGELEDVYNNLNDKYESSRDAAEDVSNRINKVQSVAESLFREWAEELELISNANLKRDSQRKLKETQRKYESLLRSMRKVESSMDPVLTSLRDNVLYLKHNLNANAVGALQGEFSTIKRDVSSLIKEMNSAISQSDDFIKSIQGQ